MTRRHLGGVALAMVLVGARLLAQTPPPPQPTGTGVIAGTLTIAGGSGPARKAQVDLGSTTPRVSRHVITDDEGRFVFDKLPAADYRVSAGKDGLLLTVYGARRPGDGMPGLMVKLVDGQKIDNLTFALFRGGVVAGRIVDEFGDPAYQAQVRAMRVSYKDGARTVTLGGTATTDDRGQYRIAALLPGDYLVSAAPTNTVASLSATSASYRGMLADRAAAARAGGDAARAADFEASLRDAPLPSSKGYAAVYYPGVVQPGASTAVPVRLGEEVGGIDVRLQIVEAVSVSGVLTSPEELPAQTSVGLIDPAMPASGVGAWFRTVGKDGRFTFYGILPGTYVLRAMVDMPPSSPGGAGLLTVEKEIVVHSGPNSDQTLKLQRGTLVSGTLKIDTLRASADASRLRVVLYPIMRPGDWEKPVYREGVDASGRFTMRGVAPGPYRVSVDGLTAGWSLASAVFDGADAADFNLTIEPDKPAAGVLAFTDRTAEIAGSVVNAAGTPVSEHTVIIFPEDRTMWVPSSRRIQLVRPGADGKYSIRNLPPGDYRVTAVLDPESGIQFDRDFLAKLVPLAAPVKVGEGERRTQDLTVR